jgi:hypothetical protein
MSDLEGCVNYADMCASVFAKRGFTFQKKFDKQATGKTIQRAPQKT